MPPQSGIRTYVFSQHTQELVQINAARFVLSNFKQNRYRHINEDNFVTAAVITTKKVYCLCLFN